MSTIAKNFTTPLIAGFNIERDHLSELSYGGIACDSNPAYFAYLASTFGTGFFLRTFITFGNSADDASSWTPSPQDWIKWIKLAVAEGIPVILDICGGVSYSTATTYDTSKFQPWITTVATAINQSGIPPNMLAIGVVNEPQGDTNGDFGPYLNKWTAQLAALCPNNPIVFGSADWKYYGGAGALNSYDSGNGLFDSSFVAPAVAASGQGFGDVHDYDITQVSATASAAASQLTGNLKTWQASNNYPVIACEFGWSASSDIQTVITNTSTIPCCFWTITSQTGGRVNASSTDGTISSGVVSAMQAGMNAVRAARGGTGGTGGTGGGGSGSGGTTQYLTVNTASVDTNGHLWVAGTKQKGSTWTIKWNKDGTYQGTVQDGATDGAFNYDMGSGYGSLTSSDTVTFYLDGTSDAADRSTVNVTPFVVAPPPPPIATNLITPGQYTLEAGTYTFIVQ